MNTTSVAEATAASGLGAPKSFAAKPEPVSEPRPEASSGSPNGRTLETQRLMERLGISFENPDLLEQALTHSSYKNENPSLARADNERLEYLGDAVLDLAMSEILVRAYPSDREGALSKKRASLVNEDVLSRIALELGLPDLILLGKGERQTGGLSKPRILASTLEAVFGAAFLDRGFDLARVAAERAFASRLASMADGPDYAADFKTRLQEKAQETRRLTPYYRVDRERGPDHDKVFEVSVRLGDAVLAVGQGRNKKSAEQEAARLALATLEDAGVLSATTASDAAESSPQTNDDGKGPKA